MTQAEKIMGAAERAGISAAVKDVESRTAGEIAVIFTDRSDDYPEGSLRAGVILGSLIAIAVSDLFLGGSLWYAVGLTLILTLLMDWLGHKVPVVTRPFISPSRLDEMVARRALTAFYDKGLYKTRDKTGVLFFISLFERRVRVMADKGIYEKITPEELQGYAHGISTGIKNKKTAEALIEEIQAVGLVLTEHFPIKDDDTNELPDEVVIV
ncbi:TPM domain-containing protein [Desulfobacterota bacterium M19]